ncbi:MAG1430 family protein [Mycoplasmopsis gallopavonis]|uniref:Uncharacterized protein n=1 Tax=Mycoplasmopsis gallopavonis TaxID=76629 RepID=A0A449AZD1_9BACT|nr:hypothetical protein [Mycoplasmopsis gallopavonis]RIV16786.1 hypothetical protein D1113_00905 [Mycoplasmopsis gallopavonis]VEU72909.1 Uncharacterised protein [Mycoplasmopsis gallopavonis]
MKVQLKKTLLTTALILGGGAITAGAICGTYFGITSSRKSESFEEAANRLQLFYNDNPNQPRNQILASKFVHFNDRLYSSQIESFSQNYDRDWRKILISPKLKNSKQIKEQEFYLYDPIKNHPANILLENRVTLKDGKILTKDNYKVNFRSYANDVEGKLLLRLWITEGSSSKTIFEKVFTLEGFAKVNQSNAENGASYYESADMEVSLNKTALLGYTNADQVINEYTSKQNDLNEKTAFLKKIFNFQGTVGTSVAYDTLQVNLTKNAQGQLLANLIVPYNIEVAAATPKDLIAKQSVLQATYTPPQFVFSFESN